MKFEFKVKMKDLNSLRSINNEVEATQDDDSTMDESSIFDSIPTNHSTSLISEDFEDKKNIFRPISCYTTPPLPNESLTFSGYNTQRNPEMIRKNSEIGKPIYASLREKEDACTKNTNIIQYCKDFDYNSLNNEARWNTFCQRVDKEHEATEGQFIIVKDKVIPQHSDNLEDNSCTSTFTSFYPEDVSNISCSTIQANNRIPKLTRMRQEFDPNAFKNRLSFLHPISPDMKIKIYINEKDQVEDVMALKVRKDQLQDVNEIIDVIICKITSIRSDLSRDNINLLIFFKQESIKPIPLSRKPKKTMNNSNLNLFDNTSLIMDYLSGREKLYIRASV